MHGSPSIVPGSFRDPSGRVYECGNRILRTVSHLASGNYDAVRKSGLLAELVADQRLVKTWEVDPSEWIDKVPASAYVLEHERIPLISYPYEWCFGQLKAAALFHLDLQIELLDRGFVLSDASAYNVQFIGSRPIFIDVLSLRQYREGEYWYGHRQFCEQFLNPLLMRSLFGVPHNSWFRGNLEGIPTQYIARLLSLRHKLSWNILSQVTLQAMLEQKAVRSPQGAIDKARAAKKLPSIGYRGILTQLREWIDRMHPADTARSVWGDYAKANTYSSTEIENKAQAIREFVSTVRPATLIDLGCNSGDFSIASLEAGAGRVVGFDFDHQAVEEAFARSFREKLNFLPLWLDAANPSPDQGWNQAERLGFGKRAQADAVIALAFEHHLIIGKNIPMAETVAWLVSLAPSGIIEFIPKSDATIQQMLALRDDIFPDYSEENFANILRSHANIVRTKIVSASGRTLYCFQK